jgi:hypothetical protein
MLNPVNNGPPGGVGGGAGGPPDEPIPDLVKALRGQREEIQEKMMALVLEKHGFNPRQFVGTIDGDPRNKHVYPDNPEDQAELLTGDSTSILSEEFQMQVQKTQGTRIDTLPPEPLTPTDLDGLLQRLAAAVGVNESDYEAWIPIEPEQIDDTAVGEYRAAVPGSILRFHLETGGVIATFSLLPCLETEVEFSWYALGIGDADGGLQNSVMEAEESQRLSGLISENGDRILETTPDRIRNASNLLNTVLHQENLSPTPDGWLVTECKRDDDASELLAPRYTGTFVHKVTDIVLEVIPEPAEAPLDDNDNGEPADESSGLSISNPNNPGNAYNWVLSFASDDIQKEIADSFSSQIAGREFTQIMKEINQLVE